MIFKKEERDGGIILGIEGAMTIYEASEIRRKVLECLGSARDLTLDLNAVTDCDTAGLQLLYAMNQTDAVEGGPIKLKDSPRR